jgi:hypothetical protein
MLDGAHVLRISPGVRISAVREGSRSIRVQPAAGSTTRLSVQAGHVYTIEFERSPAPPKEDVVK